MVKKRRPKQAKAKAKAKVINTIKIKINNQSKNQTKPQRRKPPSTSKPQASGISPELLSILLSRSTASTPQATHNISIINPQREMPQSVIQGTKSIPTSTIPNEINDTSTEMPETTPVTTPVKPKVLGKTNMVSATESIIKASPEEIAPATTTEETAPAQETKKRGRPRDTDDKKIEKQMTKETALRRLQLEYPEATKKEIEKLYQQDKQYSRVSNRVNPMNIITPTIRKRVISSMY